MAHIQDRWEAIVDGERVCGDRYGQGKRWRARYLGLRVRDVDSLRRRVNVEQQASSPASCRW